MRIQIFLFDYIPTFPLNTKKERERKNMKDILKTIETNRRKLESLPSAYQIAATDAWEIADSAGVKLSEDIMNAILTAYQYGFIKGQRYTKNRQKKTK